MPRPRRPFSGQETVTSFRTPYLQDCLPGSLSVRRQQRWGTSASWTYPTPNGNQDPLTYMHVLDMLMNIHPDIELRAAEAVRFLRAYRPNIIWDPVTVGRVISDLCDNIEDVIGKNQGLLVRGKDYKGYFYLLQRNPETAKVALALRDDLMRLAEHEMGERKAGRKTDFMGSPLLECPSVRGVFE